MPNTPKKEWGEEVREVIEALRAPSNWLQQPRGEQWEDVVNQYDRTPLQAAALLEEALSRDESLIAGLEELRKDGVGADYYSTWSPGDPEPPSMSDDDYAYNQALDDFLALIKNRNN